MFSSCLRKSTRLTTSCAVDSCRACAVARRAFAKLMRPCSWSMVEANCWRSWLSTASLSSACRCWILRLMSARRCSRSALALTKSEWACSSWPSRSSISRSNSAGSNWRIKSPTSTCSPSGQRWTILSRPPIRGDATTSPLAARTSPPSKCVTAKSPRTTSAVGRSGGAPPQAHRMRTPKMAFTLGHRFRCGHRGSGRCGGCGGRGALRASRGGWCCLGRAFGRTGP